MEAEYAFRQEVLERTGMVILETKHAPTTELRMLPPVSETPASGTGQALDVEASPALPPSDLSAAGQPENDMQTSSHRETTSKADSSNS